MKHLSSRFLAVMAVPLVLGLTATVFAPGRASAQAAGLVAAYSFNEGTGTAIADVSGSSNSGTVSGASWTGQGKYGSALSFDGVNDWVTVADAGSLDLTTGMTLEAWVYPSALSGRPTVMMKETSGGLSYALFANDGTPHPAAYIGSAFAEGGGGLPINTWTHLATTYDGATFALYINGVQVDSVGLGSSISTSNGALRIGGNAIRSEWFQGRLDEIRIYNRALTSGEIQTDMNTPIDGSLPASSCDLTQNGSVEADDVYLSVDMALGSTPCTAAVVGPGVCNVVVTQRIVNAVLGQPCVTGPGLPQSVLLSWIASPSPNVAGHNVYRATTSGGPYTKVNGSLVASTQLSDTTVEGGQTYYYVVTAVDTGNLESAYSNQATAFVPSS